MDRYQGQESANNDQPPPYSSVVGNPQYGFVVPGSEGLAGSHNDPQPKSYTAPGVYPHPITTAQPTAEGIPPPPPHSSGISVPVGIVLPPAVGTEPTTITCFNCNKLVTTRVVYSTAWHTHLAAGSICVITM
ncbi:hypothetical protein EVAR_9455_1 [Eumeta japonica]|uniref:LITAF domain-containing protein n=1 Tax=Eumeta variegata TaxID=151549 RepID=A0A4C1UE10_EUMVA|nr:hypothetical protein EVAR_9455_1 [Eumeta japonica]